MSWAEHRILRGFLDLHVWEGWGGCFYSFWALRSPVHRTHEIKCGGCLLSYQQRQTKCSFENCSQVRHLVRNKPGCPWICNGTPRSCVCVFKGEQNHLIFWTLQHGCSFQHSLLSCSGHPWFVLSSIMTMLIRERRFQDFLQSQEEYPPDSPTRFSKKTFPGVLPEVA
jgi:hypothetical protein